MDVANKHKFQTPFITPELAPDLSCNKTYSEILAGADIGAGDSTIQTNENLSVDEWSQKKPKQQSSPKPKLSEKKPASPKVTVNRNRSGNRSITVSPHASFKKQSEKSPYKKANELPPLKGKKHEKAESEAERLRSKWNNKYDREIGQNIETLEVKTEKMKLKKPKR